MYTKEFNITGHDAHTLDPEYIGKNDSGWVIDGTIHEDYYEWVNEFEATHIEYGKVWGDFEAEVFAETQEGYENFIENHPPDLWDYWDI